METYLKNLVTTYSDSGNEFEGCSWKWWIHFIPTQIFPDPYNLSKNFFWIHIGFNKNEVLDVDFLLGEVHKMRNAGKNNENFEFK
jgi:hypothetical protein